MAKVPPPKTSRKGPPPPIAKTAGNLDKPESRKDTKSLTVQLPDDFKRRLKVYAAEQGCSMTSLLIEGFNMLCQAREHQR